MRRFGLTGSTGFGYDIAKKFGHIIVEPLPALVQLRLDGTYFKEWTGIRSDVSIKLYENNKLIKEEIRVDVIDDKIMYFGFIKFNANR